MSRRLWALPLRTISDARQPTSQWMCRRCFASQTDAASSGDSITSPPMSSSASIAESSSQNTQPSLVSRSSASPRDWSHLKYLGQPLPHAIPPQYLEYCHDSALSATERAQRGPPRPHKKIQGVVVSAGKMKKTVKVRVPRQEWNKRIGKFYDAFDSHLVHDPNNSLVAGDVVDLHRLRASSTVHHVVAAIVSPFGKPIDQRPPVPSPEERLDAYKAERLPKIHRRELRKKAAEGDVDAIAEAKALDEAAAKAWAAHGGKGPRTGAAATEGTSGAGSRKLNQRAVSNARKTKLLENAASQNAKKAKRAARDLSKTEGLAASSAVTPGSERTA